MSDLDFTVVFPIYATVLIIFLAFIAHLCSLADHPAIYKRKLLLSVLDILLCALLALAVSIHLLKRVELAILKIFIYYMVFPSWTFIRILRLLLFYEAGIRSHEYLELTHENNISLPIPHKLGRLDRFFLLMYGFKSEKVQIRGRTSQRYIFTFRRILKAWLKIVAFYLFAFFFILLLLYGLGFNTWDRLDGKRCYFWFFLNCSMIPKIIYSVYFLIKNRWIRDQYYIRNELMIFELVAAFLVFYGLLDDILSLMSQSVKNDESTQGESNSQYILNLQKANEVVDMFSLIVDSAISCVMAVTAYAMPLYAILKNFKRDSSKTFVDFETELVEDRLLARLKHQLASDFCIENGFFIEVLDFSDDKFERDDQSLSYLPEMHRKGEPNDIYECFISSGSVYELNLPYQIVEELTRKKQEGSLDYADFSKARNEILNSIFQNSYQRYLRNLSLNLPL